MATIAAMNAVAVTGAFGRNMQTSSTSRTCHSPALATRRFTQIRCNAEPESKPTPVEEVPPSIPTASIPTAVFPPQPVATKPKVSTRFEDVFAFNGPAPETINGRLAMLGFVAALGTELATGESLTTQLGNGGVSALIFATVLFSTASLIPLFQGVSVESKSKGIFTKSIETWNGRAAMIGLVALAITEFVSGRALV